jgi:hypothetical protein
MPTCHACHSEFPDFKELAIHIMANKKGHRKGRMWAAKYIMINGLSPDKRIDRKTDHIALTAEQKEAKKDCKGTISGIRKMVETVCPKCKRMEHQSLPVEYIGRPLAWRKDNRLVILCEGCGSKG